MIMIFTFDFDCLRILFKRTNCKNFTKVHIFHSKSLSHPIFLSLIKPIFVIFKLNLR